MSNLTGKKVLVTGGGGFIGSHLCDMLVKSGCNVRAMVRYNGRNDIGNLRFLEREVLAQIEVLSLDIADPFSVRQAVEGCDCVFHLAALIGIPYSYVAPHAYLDTNIRGTLNVLEAVRKCETPRMVHTSTSESYGSARFTPMNESHPLQGQSPYSASKIAADKLAESYWCSFKTPVATLRPFNTFGPRQSARAVIPTVVSQFLKSNTIKLGSLTPVRDFTFVTDTARAFIAVANSEAALGRTLNSANGKGITIGELANLIGQLIHGDKKFRIESQEERIRPDASEVVALIGDASELNRLTGWAPSVSLEDGLKEVVSFVSANQKLFATDAYVI